LHATVSRLLPAILAPQPLPEVAGTPRLPLRTLFISDVHLGSRGCRADALLGLLEHVRVEQLVVIGDLIDFWSLRRSFHWPASHTAVLHRLLAHAREGARVVYVPGNHDAELREFVGSTFGRVEIHRDHVHRTARGERLLVLHGDEFDGIVKCAPWLATLGSHMYDATLEINRQFNRLRNALGYSYWSLASYLKMRVPNAQAYIDAFEQAAVHEAKRRNLDGVVCGHIHRPRLRSVDGLLYCNDGDWVESCSAIVEDRNGRLALWDWNEMAQADAGRSAVAVSMPTAA
jgi:UDP-2,3-diacylglucosamine pyrophosphatase LpxH